MMRVREVPREKREKLRRGYLFIPKIFSYGTVIENVELETYFKNPTKVSRALKEIYRFFNADGIFCWDKLSNFEDSSQLNVVVDIIKRINIMLPDLPIACEIQGSFSQKITEDLIKIIETLGSAGLDILIFRGEFPDATSISSMANVANFFGLNPLVIIDNFDLEKHRDIIEAFGGVIASDSELLSTLRSEFKKRMGFMFDLKQLEKYDEKEIRSVIARVININPFLLTTNRDLGPYDSQAVIQKIRLIGKLMRRWKK